MRLKRQQLRCKQQDQSIRRYRALTHKLNAPISHIQFNETPAKEAVRYWAKQTGIPIYLNWKRFIDYGLETDIPISLNLHNVPAHVALSLILRQVSLDQPLHYNLRPHYLHITIQEEDSRHPILRAYNIRAIQHHVPDFTDAPDLSLPRNGRSTFKD